MGHFDQGYYDYFAAENFFDYTGFYVPQECFYCGGPAFYHNCEDYLQTYPLDTDIPYEPPPYNPSLFPHNRHEELYHIDGCRPSCHTHSPPRSPPPSYDPPPPSPDPFNEMYLLNDSPPYILPQPYHYEPPMDAPIPSPSPFLPSPLAHLFHPSELAPEPMDETIFEAAPVTIYEVEPEPVPEEEKPLIDLEKFSENLEIVKSYILKMYALEDATKEKELEMQRHEEETPEPPMGKEEDTT